jgi:TldD protein
MIEHLPVEKILKAALSQGGDFAEIFIEESIITTIVNDDKRLENVLTSTDAGIGIRVMSDTKTAYGSTNDVDALPELATSVSKAAVAPGSSRIPLKFKKAASTFNLTIKQHPFGIALPRKTEIVERAVDVAWKTGHEIQQVRVTYRDKVRKIEIATSDGRLAADEQPETLLLVHVVASDGGILQTGYEPVGGTVGFELFEMTLPEEIALVAAKRAIRMLHASPAKAGPMPVILAADAGGTMIHEAVGHGLEADLACVGLSVYAGRKGQRVANPIITVYDDATILGRRGSFAFDDEGTCAQKTCLIDRGVLVNYLTDRVWAIRQKTPSTGNGRRESYEYPPIVRMTNTYIASGKDIPEKIIRETDKGLYVTRMGGGQVNTVNGDFIFEIQECYRIEHGKIGEPVRGATLIGNGPKVLEIIDRVGNDLGFSIGTCSKNGQDVPVGSAQPTIRIPEIVVGGTC